MSYHAIIGKEGETTFGKPRPRLLAWMQEESRLGLVYTACWLPIGDEPEFGRWIRAPWLDEPE